MYLCEVCNYYLARREGWVASNYLSDFFFFFWGYGKLKCVWSYLKSVDSYSWTDHVYVALREFRQVLKCIYSISVCIIILATGTRYRVRVVEIQGKSRSKFFIFTPNTGLLLAQTPCTDECFVCKRWNPCLRKKSFDLKPGRGHPGISRVPTILKRGIDVHTSLV